MGKIPVGVQMYTLRDEAEKDFVGTLKQVAEIGYNGVEFAGYYGHSAKDLKQIVSDLGLATPSAHVGLNWQAPDQWESDFARQVEYASELGIKYIVLPGMPYQSSWGKAELDEAIAKIRKAAEMTKAAGMTYGYHNHAFEFDKIEGEYVLDTIYRSIGSDLLVCEIDAGWVHRGGIDPAEYMSLYKGRVPLVHVKDFTAENEFTEVGNGVVNFKGVFDSAQEAGIEYYIVEQDYCSGSQLESIKISLNYLKGLGIA